MSMSCRQIFRVGSEKRDDTRSISKMNTADFRLVQTLLWSNSPTSNIDVLCCKKTISYLSQMSYAMLLL
jgi:hypothetical protein